jgi:hypothetical protein
MKLKGVSYDVGCVMGINWRPKFDLKVVHRELEIIKNDLHCNAVRICGLGINRLMTAAEDALEQGLEVWFSPQMWDKSPSKTLTYITKAAAMAERLRHQWPDQLVFSVGSEATLFMQGILEGKNFTARISNPSLIPRIREGEHNKPLNEFLTKATTAVRAVFHGKVIYASLIWEAVDWKLFDYVGIDHYRATKIENKYVEMLKPSFSYGKPVVITEVGYATTHGTIGEEGFLSSAGLGKNIIDPISLFLHYKIPILGRFVRPHLNGDHARDEAWQAHKLVETLGILDGAGVYGTFISQFISQISPYSSNPRYDLDMANMSLVRYYEGGKHGTTYPDMPWEPKEAFKAVADYYAKST